MGKYQVLENQFIEAMQPYSDRFHIAVIDKSGMDNLPESQDKNTLTVTAQHKERAQRCRLQIQVFIHPEDVQGVSVCAVVGDDQDHYKETDWSTDDRSLTVEVAIAALEQATLESGSAAIVNEPLGGADAL